ncbi:hypothetical protein ACH40D_46510, partial [Streptomyces olivaceoviridis]
MSEEARGLIRLLTGAEYPEIEAWYLRALAEQHRVTAAALRRLGVVVGEVERAARAQFLGGVTQEALGKRSRVLRGVLGDVADGYDANADALLKTALTVEYAQFMAWAMLAWFVAEIFIAVVTLRFHLIPEIYLVARTQLSRLLSALLEHVVTSMTLEVGVAGALDRIVQQVQRSRGYRREFDREATRSALVGGALGGALAIPAGVAAERIAHVLASHLGAGVRTAVEARLRELGAGDELAAGLGGDVGAVLSRSESDLPAAFSSGAGSREVRAQGATRFGEAFGEVFVTHFAPTAGTAGGGAAGAGVREAGRAYGQALFHALAPRTDRKNGEVFGEVWDLPAAGVVPAAVRAVLDELPGVIRQETASGVQWLRSAAGLLSGGVMEGAGESLADLLSNLALTGQAATDPFTFVSALFAGIAQPALADGASKAAQAAATAASHLKDHTTIPTATTQPTPPSSPASPTPTSLSNDPATTGTDNDGPDTASGDGSDTDT